MSALVLDAGALLAVERGDRETVARLRIAQQRDIGLRSNTVVVAQVWRDHAGRQAALARLLRAVEVCTVDERTGRDAGVLLGRAGTSDVVDATVALLARPGDRILTSDPAGVAGSVRAVRGRGNVPAPSRTSPTSPPVTRSGSTKRR